MQEFESLRGLRKGINKWSCLETAKWRIAFLCKKWLNINKELVYRKMINCMNRHVNNIGRYKNNVFKKNQMQIGKYNESNSKL
jgi:hypothetical protein